MKQIRPKKEKIVKNRILVHMLKGCDKRRIQFQTGRKEKLDELLQKLYI